MVSRIACTSILIAWIVITADFSTAVGATEQKLSPDYQPSTGKQNTVGRNYQSQAENPRFAVKSNEQAQLALLDDKNKELITHLLNRMAFGPYPGEIDEVQQIGIERYIQQQLHPDSIVLPDNVRKVTAVAALEEDPSSLFLKYGRPAMQALAKRPDNNELDKKEKQKLLKESYRKLYLESAKARIVRAVDSPQELKEVMTDFWFNHFNISFDKGLDHVLIGNYEENAIRPYALGKFRDLLGATAHHAAMLFYLDNWQNTVPNSGIVNEHFKGINENYARELLELHTLGVDGGYSQKDVQELARILTGLGLQNRPGSQLRQQLRPLNLSSFQAPSSLELPGNKKFGSYFNKRRHDFGDKIILGHLIKGKGEEEIEETLDFLARHPSTAKHISYQLAQYFVCDKPPNSLVQKLTNEYLKTDGHIASVLNTLFHSPEFWDEKYRKAKYKSPYQYLVSTLRACNVHIENIKPVIAFLKQSGMPLYQCLTPDGYKNTEESWLNPDNLLDRLAFATALGTGRFPGVSLGIADYQDVLQSIGPLVSQKTTKAIARSPMQLRVALLLGSPEFMRY